MFESMTAEEREYEDELDREYSAIVENFGLH